MSENSDLMYFSFRKKDYALRGILEIVSQMYRKR